MPRTKKTRNAVGSIFPRKVKKDGKTIQVYDARLCYPVIGPDGKKRYKTVTQRCYSHSEALTALANLPNKIAEKQQNAAPAAAHTFHDLAAYYRREYCKPAVFSGDQQIEGFRQDPKTIAGYTREFEAFFGDAPLSAITYEDCRRYKVYVASTPIKRPGARIAPEKLPEISTVNRKLSYLRAVLNVGVQLRWITSNPFNEGKALIEGRSERARTRALEYEEEERLLAACTDPDEVVYERDGKTVRFTTDNRRSHLKLIVLIAIDTGLRKKELFGLLRENIRLDAHVIDLPARKTKALKRRIIPLTSRLEDAFREYFEHISFHPKAPIFFGQKDADKAFATACRRAGITGFHFHDLRHTATTWMDEAAISLNVKQGMAGHADSRVHQDYHAMTSDIVRSVRAKMDAHAKVRQEFREAQKASKKGA